MTVYKRDNSWRFRISYKKADGTYSRINSKENYRTKKEAELAEFDLKQKMHRGFDVSNSELLFTDYFEEWYEIYRKGKNSIENDKDILRAINFAKKSFPFIKLKELDRKTYQKKLNEFASNHATATVKKHHTYMRMCIKEAIQEQLIFRDPTYNIIVKGKVPQKKESEKFLSEAESQLLISSLLEGLKEEYLSRYIILFQLSSGARFSEALGLTWDCVDFSNNNITINKTWDYKYTNDFSNTKNYASNRTITMDNNTMHLLKQLKTAQQKQKLQNFISKKKNLVFASFEDGLPVSNNAVNKVLRRFSQPIAREIITSHGLRHTHASILLYRGVNIKYISRRLGHKDIITTLQTYSHIIDEMEQKSSREVDEVMNILYKIN
ncbi:MULTISPECIES: site-specific integrase [Listeria]|uniref:tyrosine-type recombinase/integrase n=1 Tax=Listeria TaxID=1637 RepID=UPI000B596784|nr:MULTISPECIES: site-specific integrase [Listeria]